MGEETKKIDRKTLDRADQMREADKPKPPRKEGKSPFDELLDQNRLAQQSTLDNKSQTKTVTQQAASEVERQQERQKDQSKDRDKEEDPKQESRDDRKQTEMVGKKVVGKAGLKEQKGESGGQGFEGGGGGGHKKSGRQAIQTKKEMGANQTNALAHKAFAQAFQKALAQSSKDLPKTLPQEVLNQVVRYVRIGLNKQGNKEVELDLHQNVFKGLRLRFSSRHGKVDLHFLAANAEVRDLFERESPQIREALEKKGIAVENIRVT